MTHYLFFVGAPGSGKGSILESYRRVGYRVAIMTAATAPNIYRLLGSVEVGQVTIIMDEANHIEDDQTLLEVLKTGYKANGFVPRISDGNSSNASQDFYYTYCFKMLAAENGASRWKVGGFVRRFFEIKTTQGEPNVKVDKLGSPEADPQLKRLSDELDTLRRLLFCYRLIHHGDTIPDVKLNVDGGEEELCSGLFRLFRGAKCLNAISEALIHFLKEQRTEAEDTYDAYLSATILNLDKVKKAMYGFAEIKSKDLWEQIKTELDGQPVPDKPQMISTRYNNLSPHMTTKILKERFGVVAKHDGSERVLQIDIEKFRRSSRKFGELPDTLEAKQADTSNAFNSLWEKATLGTSKTEPAVAKQEPESAYTQKVLEVLKVSEPVPCDICNELYENKAEYELHYATKHGESTT
jgi:hypothetical protein